MERRVVLAPEHFTSMDIRKIINDFDYSHCPRSDGWTYMARYPNKMKDKYSSEFGDYTVEQFMRRILGVKSNSYCNRTWSSADDRIMIITKDIDGIGKEMWAKDVVSHEHLEVVPCFLVYNFYDSVAIIKRTQRVKFNDCAIDGDMTNQMIWGNSCARNLVRRDVLSITNTAEHDEMENSIEINIPLISTLKVATCNNTGIAIIGSKSIVAYEDYGDDGYSEVTRHFISKISSDNYLKDHYYGCQFCQRFVPKNDVRGLRYHKDVYLCPDCIAERVYTGSIRATVSPKYFSNALNNLDDYTSHVCNTIKSVQYTVEPWGEVLTGIDMSTRKIGTWIRKKFPYLHGGFHESSYALRGASHIEVPVVVKGRQDISPMSFDFFAEIDVAVHTGHSMESGFILMLSARKVIIALLFMREGGEMRMWGRIDTGDLEKAVSIAMSEGKDNATMYVIFSEKLMSSPMLRAPVSIVVPISGHEDLFNDMRRRYAKKLIKGKE